MSYPRELNATEHAELLRAFSRAPPELHPKPVCSAPDALAAFAWSSSSPSVKCSDLETAMQVTRRDFELDDAFVDAYMRLLNTQQSEALCLPALTAQLVTLDRDGFAKEHLSAERLRRVKRLVVPVPVEAGEGGHWIVCSIRNGDRSRGFCHPIVDVYDSLSSMHTTCMYSALSLHEVVDRLLECMCVEQADRLKVPAPLGICSSDRVGAQRNEAWILDEWPLAVQHDSANCGFFVCEIAKRLATEVMPMHPPPREEHMERYRLRIVYELSSGKLLVE